MEKVKGIVIKDKIRELIGLIKDEPISSDFENACLYIYDDFSYPSILCEIVDEGIETVKKETDKSTIWINLRHRCLSGIHSVIAGL